MKVSIIIPCYNEVSTIEQALTRVRQCPIERKEIIVVDDCSTDGTREFLTNCQKHKDEYVVYHDRNRGKGAAVRNGIATANGDIIVIQDADLEYHPDELPQLLAPLHLGLADVVYGSRFIGRNIQTSSFLLHRFGNQVLTLLSNVFTGLKLTDMETGYKAFRAEVIKRINIEEPRFGFEPEVTAKIAKIVGIRVCEVGISYRARSYAEGKKVGPKDAFRAVYCAVRYSVLN